MKSVHSFDPDSLVINVALPDIDGVEVCYRLRHAGDRTLPILLVSCSNQVADKVSGLESGADDYIASPFDFEELAARIRAKLRRAERTRVRTRRVEVEGLVLDARARKVWRNDNPIHLSAREYDLLELLARNVGQVLTRGYIFDQVWPRERGRVGGGQGLRELRAHKIERWRQT